MPTTLDTLCLFAQFLSRSFKSDSSVRNYISGVKALHTLLALPFPATGSELRLVLRGIRRLKSRPPHQAAPITLSLLKDFFSLLDLTQPIDSVFWCLFLMAFYTLARKSNLVASSIAGRRRPNKQILRSDVQLSSAGLLVTFRWTKTMQDGSRPLVVPCVAVPGSILCPVQAFSNMLDRVPAPSHGAAFVLPHKHGVRPVTYKDFMLVLRCLIASLGLDPSKFSSHSFRHGGTTFAYRSGVPDQLIKVQGDWASDAYTRYLHHSLDSRLVVASLVRDYVLLNEWIGSVNVMF